MPRMREYLCRHRTVRRDQGWLLADLTLAIGTSHSPMLNSPAEDFARHAEIDQAGRKLLDKDGRPCSYEELERQVGPEITAQLTLDVLRDRVAQCQAGIDRLAKTIQDSAIDVLVIVGDDQREQFFDDNMPAISIFWGAEITNNVLDLPDDAPEFWKRARSQYHETSGPRSYPVDSDLARHLIDTLVDQQFDISLSRELRFERGEGHAFGFVHRRLLSDPALPVVPVSLNTYFPPNQPRPNRCYELGVALRDAIASWPQDRKVGILASGGLSHFVVDEVLDEAFLKACREKDRDALTSIPLNKLNSGNSEIRNWITVAGAAEQLDVEWTDYIPCYRSSAGTGIGVAFAIWS
jgi:Catalytic LigB subunit of aromatic ring-opening dioxygenase